MYIPDHHGNTYIMEYALDYGLIRMSPSVRKRFNVPVTLIVLDPTTHACFGDTLASFVFSHLVGYDDLLLTAVKHLAESDESRGYLR